MRDRLSEIEFEEREGVLVARIAGEVDGSNAVELGARAGRAAAQLGPRPGAGPQLGRLPRQRRHRAALQPRPAAGRPSPAAAPRGPAALARAARARDLRHRQRRPDRRLRPRTRPRRSSPTPEALRPAQTARVAAAQEARKPSSACCDERAHARAAERDQLGQPAGQRLQQQQLLAPGGRGWAGSPARARRSGGCRPTAGRRSSPRCRRRAPGGSARGARARRGPGRPRPGRSSPAAGSALARALDRLSQASARRRRPGRSTRRRRPRARAGRPSTAARGAVDRPGAGARRAAGRGQAGERPARLRRSSPCRGAISRRRSASTTACERVEAPSLAIALRMWVRTVSGESTSRSAIWAPLRPSASSSKTSRSRFESGPRPLPLRRRASPRPAPCALRYPIGHSSHLPRCRGYH